MDKLEKIHKNIHHKYIQILHHTTEYKNLFIENKELDEMIKQTRSSFFEDLYTLYWSYLTININALVDKKSTFNNENLSIYNLLETIKKLNLKCTKTIELNLDKIKTLIKPFNRARNKVFAHYDTTTALNKTHMDELKLEDLDTILVLIKDILISIETELEYPKKTYLFKNPYSNTKIITIIKNSLKS